MTAKDAREQRLAEALRANLRRRKTQAREQVSDRVAGADRSAGDRDPDAS